MKIGKNQIKEWWKGVRNSKDEFEVANMDVTSREK